MDLGLSKDELALQARARAFSQEVVRPRAAAIDRDEQYPWDIVKALAKAGFLGMTMPKALGGQDRSFLDAVLVIEEMAKSCTVTARIVVETNMGAISTVMAYGNEAQKQLAARLVLEGDKPAICITEPDAGSDTLAMTTRADKRGDVYVINGRKHWITGAGVSKLHLIFARVFDERGQELGIGGFLAVRDETKGLRVTRREQTMGLRGMPEGELAFEDLEVPADMAVLPPSGFRRGFADLMNAYNSQRVGAGTVAMGIAGGALEHALAMGQDARAIRPPDRRIPGPAMDARRHADPAHRLAADALCGGALARARRQRLSRPDAGGAGEDLRLGSRDQNRQRRAAAVRRARLFARAAARTHGARRAHVHHRRRHRAGAAHAGCVQDAGLEAAADARRLCAEAFDARRRGVTMHPMFASAGDARAIPIWFVHAANLDSVRQSLGERERAFVAAAGFEPKPGRLLLLPSADGKLSGVLFGLERPGDAVIDPFRPGQLSGLLPPGSYRFANAPHDARLAALAFALGAYQFTPLPQGRGAQRAAGRCRTASTATISPASSKA